MDKTFTQSTSLMPDKAILRQQGPMGFIMGNTFEEKTSFRRSGVVVDKENVNFPDVDLPFIMQRPVEIKSATWQTTQTAGTELFRVTPTDIEGVPTFKQLRQFQTYFRYDVKLEVTTASVASSVGSLIIYWVPVDYLYGTAGNIEVFNAATVLEHQFLQPYKQASAIVTGRFMRPCRYNLDTVVQGAGTFVCAVWNTLGGSSATPASNSVQVTAYLSFENVSTKLPKAPPTPSFGLSRMSVEDKRKLALELQQDLDPNKKDVEPEMCGDTEVEFHDKPVTLETLKWQKKLMLMELSRLVDQRLRTDEPMSNDEKAVCFRLFSIDCEIKACKQEKKVVRTKVVAKDRPQVRQCESVYGKTRLEISQLLKEKEALKVQLEQVVEQRLRDDSGITEKEHVISGLMFDVEELLRVMRYRRQEEPEMCGETMETGEGVEPPQMPTAGLQQTTADVVAHSDTDAVEKQYTDYNGGTINQVVGGRLGHFVGFHTAQHGHMKLMLQRFSQICFLPGNQKNTWKTTMSAEVLFRMTLQDMMKCYSIASMYYCCSGGMRVKILTNADNTSVRGIFHVSTPFSEQYFNVRKNPEITLTVPFFEQFPVYTMWNNIFSPLQYFQLSATGTFPKDFAMRIFLAPADDFVMQVPMPGLDRTKVVWNVKPTLYQGETPTPGFEEEPERKGDDFTEVVDTVANLVKMGGQVFGLFDRPDAPNENEWSMIDQPIPTVRLGYCDADVVKHDETVTCDTRGIDMMDLTNVLAMPCRLKVTNWTTAKTHLQQLDKVDVKLSAYPLATKGLDGFIPRFYRGTFKFVFEFIKNVFHKGTVAFVFVPPGETFVAANYTNYYTVVFDISKGDTLEFNIPYAYHADYRAADDAVGTIYILCINALTAQNTTAAVDINTYMSMGEDLQLRYPQVPEIYTAYINTTYNLAGPFVNTQSGSRQVRVRKPKRRDSVDEEYVQCSDERVVRSLFKREGLLKTTQLEADYLKSCDLRIGVYRNLGVKKQKTGLGHMVITTERTMVNVHMHTDDVCLNCIVPPHWTDVEIFETILAEAQTCPKIPDFPLKKVKKKTKFVNVPYRIKGSGKERRVVIWHGRSLISTKLGDADLFDVIDTLQGELGFPIEGGVPAINLNEEPEMCGAFVSKTGEQFGEGVKKSLDVQGIKQDFSGLLAELGQKLNMQSEEVIDTLLCTMALKAPAYMFLSSSVVGVRGIIGIILQVCSDLIVVFKGHALIKSLFSGICEAVVDLVGLLVTPEQKGLVENVPESVKALWQKSCEVLKPFCDSAWMTLSSFAKMVSPVAIVGTAVRGLSYIAEVLKKIVNWFGFCLTRKQKKLKEVKKWLKDNAREVQENLDQMKGYVITGNPHALVTDPVNFYRIKKLVGIALQYKERLSVAMGVEGLNGELSIIDKFLRKAQELPCDPLNADGFEPVFILLEGAPGLGKSIMSKKLAKMFAKVISGNEDSYYRLQMDQDYYTGCADQRVFVIDDLFQDPTGEGVSKLCQLISCVGFATPKADISGKFGMSQASVVIGSSNSAEPTVGSLTEKYALIRRYKQTHFHLNETGWRQVHHGSGNDITYSQYLDEGTVSYRVQKHLETKWKRHLELKKAKPFAIVPELGALMYDERVKSQRMHSEQVGLCVLEIDQGSENFFSEEEEEPEMKGDTNPLLLDGSDLFDGSTKNLLLLQELCSGDQDEFNALVETHFGRGFTFAKRELLKTPWVFDNTADNVFSGDLSIFKNYVYKGDMSLPTDRFCLSVAAEEVLDVLTIANLLGKSAEKPAGRLKKWMAAMSKLLRQNKLIVIATVALAVGLSAVAVAYLCSTEQVEECGAYDTRPFRGRSNRIVAAVKEPSRKGYIEVKGTIEKSVLGWECVTPSKGPIRLHCFSVGQGYVLVNSHGVNVGMQHYITYLEGGVKRKVPVHLTEANICKFACGENEEQDLVLVWIGSTIPMRKSTLNYFVSQAQLETLNFTQAQVLLERQGVFRESRGFVEWKDEQFIKSTSLGLRVAQKCFVGPMILDNGDCGSPLMVDGTGLDGKIFGIASASNAVKGVFLPITREGILDAMTELCADVQDSELELCGSFVEDLLNNTEVTQDYLDEVTPVKREFQYPQQNPQFVQVESFDPPVHLNLSTKLVCHAANFEMLGHPVKEPAITCMYNSKNKIKLPTGHVADATILTKELPIAEFDSLRLDDSLGIVHNILEYISPCVLLTESEILNAYQRVDYEKDLEINSNPINMQSVAGNTMDRKYGKRPRGFWVQEVEDFDFKQYGKELRYEVNTLEKQLRLGVIPKSVVEMHYKDELRTQDKTLEGKCRIFYVADMALWCLQKKYFGDFVAKYRAGMGFRGKHAVGCDPVKWFNVWGKALRLSSVMTTDVAGWDSSVTGWHLELVRFLIERFYTTSTPEDRMVRKCLIDMVAWSFCKLGPMTFVATGVKSGMFATTEFNSLLHTIVIVYCLTQFVQDPLDIVNWKFLTNGDDGLMELPDLLEKTRQGIEQGYKEMGFKMTSSIKTSDSVVSTIEEVVFLKRRFYPVEKKYTTYYFPRMDFGTVQSLVYYHRKGTTIEENMMSAKIFLRQGMDDYQLAVVNYYAYMYHSIPFTTWQELGKMYTGGEYEAQLWPRTPVHRVVGVPDDMWHKYALARIAESKVGDPITLDEIVEAMRDGAFCEALVWCDYLGLEFPFITCMKRQLEHHGIFVHGNHLQICCLWWYFCWLDENFVCWNYIREVVPKVDTARLNRTREVLETCPYVYFIRESGKGIREIIRELIDSFPSNDMMGWYAIGYMAHMWDYEKSLVDLSWNIMDLTGLDGFTRPMTDTEEENLAIHPVRLPVDESVVEHYMDDDHTSHTRSFDLFGEFFDENYKNPIVVKKTSWVQFESRLETVAMRGGYSEYVKVKLDKICRPTDFDSSVM